MVQGVGFRPLVYYIAKKHHIKGYVRNVGGYVEIMAVSSAADFLYFITELQMDHGNGSEIVKLDIETLSANVESVNNVSMENESMENVSHTTEAYEDFVIIHSESSEEISILPPDLPVCPNCQRELNDPANKRYHNPFISCVACGPRYTIIEELPYDRDNTTMVDYRLCEDCYEEYTSPDSRRHHAQTISCNDCGPYLILQDNTDLILQDNTDLNKNNKHILKDSLGPIAEDNHRLINQQALHQAAEIIKSGGILAVKGIGGYHFVCSPFKEEAVVNLRRLKGREEKPFAVMFETIDSIREYCNVSEEEEKLLMTKARPIVLLYMHRDVMAPSTNKGSIYCGTFLPYTPLQILLTRDCGPLIMTSGNISGSPIIREDEKMLSLRSPYLQGVLYNTRRIVRSVDDSVAKIIDHKPQLIRRSRGFVPYPVFLPLEEKKASPVIFAAGGDLKAAYCLYKKGAAVVSQYFGDLEEESVLKEYIHSREDVSGLLKMKPTLAVCDMHPNYHSAHYAEALGLPLFKVQHHHAHIASVMAEHGLNDKVIGIAFDGTGYGTDGNIWGGEFLVCEGAQFTRAAHLSYTQVLGGDQSMKDARKTATCYLLKSGLEGYITDERTEVIRAALEHKVNTVLTSSMGRLFDAVASLLDIGQVNRYEGECAANLEREAVLAIRENIKGTELTFAITPKGEIIEVDSDPLLRAICEQKAVTDARALALGFHYAVADMILNVCLRLRERYHTDRIAISGGVFQNSVLTEQTCRLLRENGFTVYYNLAVPPNDGCISLGQTYVGLMQYQDMK
ncbi:(NiFe) hydrogenase maturation protein HypF [Lachnoclostridium phytofermentans ISDg]|uniref:Carbamoyltransferase n=2 Tax=Lachnoclostridium phytofermentans TaxID=66219 RepID=A9KS78_LACP7|nr:(NiFe) hydrogenase maturation protein HypF [Lachnoclostridium phytofermentans ISDg]